jgi:hypothetical protein
MEYVRLALCCAEISGIAVSDYPFSMGWACIALLQRRHHLSSILYSFQLEYTLLCSFAE